MARPLYDERLMELVGLVRDGGLDDAQTAELESILDDEPVALAYYVEAIDVTSMLYRQQGIADTLSAADSETANLDRRVSSVSSRSPGHPRWLTALTPVALCASLAIGVLVGRTWLTSDDVGPLEAVTTNLVGSYDEPEIATLSSASGCRWDPSEPTRYEGQRLARESLRLVEGVAIIHFDCDVRLILEGPAHLDLASVDHAVLHQGKAVFRGEGDLDQFTLSTPFSKIQDEGTEYAVSVDALGEVEEVHVFDGRVVRSPVTSSSLAPSQTAVQLDAGQARRFSGLRSIESIQLDASRFVRERRPPTTAVDAPSVTESFAYDGKALVGQSGGSGWAGPWVQPSRFESLANGIIHSDESLRWPQQSEPPDSGSLIIQDNVGMHRTLRDPIRMDRNAAYYLSFLVRKNSASDSGKSNGWAYVTLRDPEQEAEKIAFSPASSRGVPRLGHKGRTVNATRSLRDDQVYLVVCKILARKHKPDQVYVRIYGDHESIDSVEPSAWTITSRPIRDDSVLSELRLYSQNSEPIELDDFQFGKTWSSVTTQYSNEAAAF